MRAGDCCRENGSLCAVCRERYAWPECVEIWCTPKEYLRVLKDDGEVWEKDRAYSDWLLALEGGRAYTLPPATFYATPFKSAIDEMLGWR